MIPFEKKYDIKSISACKDFLDKNESIKKVILPSANISVDDFTNDDYQFIITQGALYEIGNIEESYKKLIDCIMDKYGNTSKACAICAIFSSTAMVEKVQEIGDNYRYDKSTKKTSRNLMKVVSLNNLVQPETSDISIINAATLIATGEHSLEQMIHKLEELGTIELLGMFLLTIQGEPDYKEVLKRIFEHTRRMMSQSKDVVNSWIQVFETTDQEVSNEDGVLKNLVYLFYESCKENYLARFGESYQSNKNEKMS